MCYGLTKDLIIRSEVHMLLAHCAKANGKTAIAL
jgi:hypothetical protein